MVPIEHHTTVHGIDWTQPTGHGRIVHENNCAPRRLDTLPVDTIVHQPTVHRVDCARPIGHGSIAHRYNCAPYSLNTVSIGKIEHRSFVHPIDCARAIRHDSVMHRYKWAPERLHTPFFEKVRTGEFITKLTVHHRVSTIQLHMRETGHQVNWARVKLRTVSIEHEHNYAPYRISTSTTVHHGCYSFAYLSESLLGAFCPVLLKHDGARSAGFLWIYFRSIGESIYAK